MKPDQPNPKEHDEQAAFIRWHLELARAERDPEVLLLHAIPNEQKAGIKLVRYLKAEGLKPGVPDMFWPVPRKPYHGLYIEMKRRHGGQVSDNQKWFMGQLAEQGYCVKIAAGFDAAKAVFLEYRRLPRWDK